MRKFFTLLFIAMTGFAAVSQAALSGTYTVGGTTPDYATPAAAASALVSQGVSGPVTFNIRPGTYTGKVDVNAFAGASEVNRVTFQSENGDSTSVIITDVAGSTATGNYTVSVYGADYVTFRQVTISRTGSGTYSVVFRIDNIATGTTIENCVLVGQTGGSNSTNNVIIYSPAGGVSADSITTVRHNNIFNGAYGVYFAGPNVTLREPRNNVSDNYFAGQIGRAIHLQDQRNPEVHHNIIESATTAAGFYGIYTSNVDRGMNIHNNRLDIRGTGNSYGIHLNNSVSTAGSEGLIANNSISMTGTGTQLGIHCVGSSFQKIYYNSINIYSTVAAAVAFNINGTANANLSVMNNNFVCKGGRGILVPNNAASALVACNYNNLFGGAATGSWADTNRVTLADWQAASGYDANSVSGDPQYVSDLDLHAASAIVNDNAMAVPEVTEDFDGDTRSATNPDMGADEFTPLADNVGPVAFISPAVSSCGDDSVTVTVTIRNFGGAAQSNIPVTVELTGAVTATLTDTYAGPLNSGATATITFAQTFNTSAGGTVNFSAFTALTGDQDNSNDTILYSANFLQIPNAPSSNPLTLCIGGTISTTTDSGFTTFWYDSANAAEPIAVGNTFAPTITSDATYYVEARQDGVGGCLRITEVALDDPAGFGDYIEVQNISGLAFDATGWKVVASDSYTDINLVNTSTWDLGIFQPGEIQYRTDGSTNPWGANLLFNPGNNAWVMIIDDNGNVIDYVAIGFTESEILNQNISAGGFTNITIGSEWSGDGTVACGTSSVSRTGATDNNNAGDFPCESYTGGAQNATLSTSFTGCGYGQCPSLRVPVSVTVLPALSVSLGPDTAFSAPFSYTIDAGAGFTSYLWSDGSTGQTLTVTAAGIYSVTVTDASGCNGVDSVEVTVTTGVSNIDASFLRVFPNPASSRVSISGLDRLSGKLNVRISDMQGRIVYDSDRSASAGARMDIETSALSEGNYLLQLTGDGFFYHQQLLITRN